MTLNDLEKINQEIAEFECLMTIEDYIEYQMEYNEWLMFTNMTNHNILSL